MAAAVTSDEFGNGDITISFSSQDSENREDSLKNSSDTSQNTESHTAEVFLASVGLQPSSRDQKESPDTKSLETKPMEQSNSVLPPGWRKIYVQRMAGKTAGKYDAYIFSPDGRKHRSKTELFAYLERKNLADQYNINEFDFTVRDVHSADGADSSTSSTTTLQAKSERKRSKTLTPKQLSMSETGSKKSKKRKAVAGSPDISLPLQKPDETSSKKSKKRKVDGETSEQSSTPAETRVKFKKLKARSKRPELSFSTKKLKSSPKLKLPTKKLKVKLKFALPLRREKVSQDNTTNEAIQSEMPDSGLNGAIANNSQDTPAAEATSKGSQKDLFDQSLSDASSEMSEKVLLDRHLNDANSETEEKELPDRSMNESYCDLMANKLLHKSLGESATTATEKETLGMSRIEATKNEMNNTVNSITSRAVEESDSFHLPDYMTDSNVSEMPPQSKRYRRDSESDISNNNVDEKNDRGSANVLKSSSAFSCPYTNITSVTKTNTGSKTECNNSPEHLEFDSETESKVRPLPAEDVFNNTSKLDHCDNFEKRLQPHDVIPKKKWCPPQSPYNLIEERLDNDPWKVLVVSIFIESGEGCFEAGSLPRRAVKEFFKLCPSPKHVRKCGKRQISRHLKDYGISEDTIEKIVNFSEEYLSNPGNDPSMLYGIGRYGQETYRIFCVDEWKKVIPENRKLKEYHRWLWLNHRVFCKN